MAQYLNAFSGRQFLDANGAPYSGAKLFVYIAGSSTKATVTKDSAGLSNHTNPIILNTRGEPADGGGASQAIWHTGGQAVKLVLAPSTDTDPPIAAISTWDNLSGINDTSVTIDQWITGPVPTYVGATSFTLVGDQTSTFHIGRRIKTTNSGGTIYSTITNSAYGALTTVTVINDSGSLDSGLSAVNYGVISATNTSIPGGTHPANTTFSGTNTFSGATTLSGTNTVSGATTLSNIASATIALGATGNVWTTGDVKLTLKTTADTGWVLMNDGTIGNGSSGGTSRANADTESLFTLLWTNTINTWCAVSTGRGASAAADFAANKTIALPKALGRALAIYGAGSGLTARALAEYLGTETHALTAAETPNNSVAPNSTIGAAGGDTTASHTGTGSAHPNMQPSLFINVMIKL